MTIICRNPNWGLYSMWTTPRTYFKQVNKGTQALQLPPEKTEAPILNRGRNTWITFIQDGTNITLLKQEEYLGILLDTRRIFEEHVKRTAVKTGKTIAAINKILVNIRGPKLKRHSYTERSCAIGNIIGMWHQYEVRSLGTRNIKICFSASI